ncbi:MAG: M20/M25/M40 family metallo-hydrolase [Myxococcales bacterium]|nr:M20/M25/M40 family metallo-hydrolase [Myxococcales bacterium]
MVSRIAPFLLLVAACCPPKPAARPADPGAKAQASPGASDATALLDPREVHFANARQLTFGGDNAEAYWSFAGDRLIFQSNRAPFQCDQIMSIPANGGPASLLSSGKGRTTCPYYLKEDRGIVYASTHEKAAECPTPPDMSKGYLWGLFDYDIYRADADGKNPVRLTDNPGYDAEATVCGLDGSILFTSMRDGDLELYRMDADGKNVARLTSSPGYDGGAFFSADCKHIVWRASRPAGAELEDYQRLLKDNLVRPSRLEIYVANADGSDARQITYLGGANFAPYFDPKSERVLFSSNHLNPRSGEFDVFSINRDGTGLERITYAPGFDGFPMFSPDGTKLAFSSNRRDVNKGADGKETYRATGTPAGERDTNVFIVDWVRDARGEASAPSGADRFREAVAYLADDARAGRGVGSTGLRDSADWVESQFRALKLTQILAAGDSATTGVIHSTYRQPFEVTTGQVRGPATALKLDGAAIAAELFTPVSISASKKVAGAIVDVGWGIIDADSKRDDYKGKAVKGKIVLVHRGEPSAPGGAPAAGAPANATGITQPGTPVTHGTGADLRTKVGHAATRGALALIVVDDGDPGAAEQPLPVLAAASGGHAAIPVLVISRAAAAALRKPGAHRAELSVELTAVRTRTENVVAMLPAGGTPKPGVIVIGAHLDHLGMGGPGSGSLESTPGIHNGADDNASGVAALLEAARVLSAKRGELTRNVVFIAFSAEEMGILGSTHFTKNSPIKEPIYAMLNMDMVGRMRMNQLQVFGVESGAQWRELLAPACSAARVVCSLSGSGYGPSDHMAFYIGGAPVLHFFTGAHGDYHKTSDDTATINAAGGAQTAALVAILAQALATRDQPLTYVKSATPPPDLSRPRTGGASLGTIPAYDDDPSRPAGVKVADVMPGGAAAKAGVKAGDILVGLDAATIRNLTDMMAVLGGAKPGQKVKISVLRDGKKLTLDGEYGAPRGR